MDQTKEDEMNDQVVLDHELAHPLIYAYSH
jgi:hypothetical protein